MIDIKRLAAEADLLHYVEKEDKWLYAVEVNGEIVLKQNIIGAYFNLTPIDGHVTVPKVLGKIKLEDA